MRDIDADDLVELLLAHELADQLPASAAEVNDSLGATRAQDCQHRAKPLLVQAQRLLDGLLFHQLRERLARQRALVLEVAVHDQLPIGMASEPALAASEQLRDFVVSNPVVLLGVEHRNKHVQVGEKVLQPKLTLEVDGEVPAVAPLGELLVQRMVYCMDDIPERLEQTPQDSLATRARQRGQMRPER